MYPCTFRILALKGYLTTMVLLSNITALIDQLNQELAQVEREAIEGLTLARTLLSQFPDNAFVIQLFAYLNTALLFVENSKGQIQAIVESLSPDNLPDRVIQERGEYLATLLGGVMEVKITVRRVVMRLEDLS